MTGTLHSSSLFKSHFYPHRIEADEQDSGQVQGHTGACVNTAEVTGTGTLPTGTTHNHSSPATTTAEPSPTDDGEDDSGAGALALHVFAATAVVFGYAVLAALY